MSKPNLPNYYLKNVSKDNPMNNIALVYCGRIISIAQHIVAIDEHSEPIVTMEARLLPHAGVDYHIVHYNESPSSLINALLDLMSHVDKENLELIESIKDSTTKGEQNV